MIPSEKYESLIMKNSENSPALKIIETALACQERMDNDPKFRDEVKGFTTAHSRAKKTSLKNEVSRPK